MASNLAGNFQKNTIYDISAPPPFQKGRGDFCFVDYYAPFPVILYYLSLL